MATVIISSELMEALEAKLKEQAETISRLTAELAQCKHALDDDDLDAAMCKCGHPLRGHSQGVCIESCSDGLVCECNNFEVAK